MDNSTTPHLLNETDSIEEVSHGYDKSLDRYSETLIQAKTGSIIFLIIVGIIGNSLSILVTIKQGLIKTGIWCYNLCLAISDNCVLIILFLYEFSEEPVNYWGDILISSIFICKLFLTSSSVIIGSSNTILAFMTISRAITIVSPYTKPPGQKRAFIMTACIIIYVMVLYVPYGTIVFGVVSYPIGMNDPLTGQPIVINTCGKLPKFAQYFDYFWWADLFVVIIIPAVSIISANIAIILNLIKRSRNKTIQRNQSKKNIDLKITYMLIFASTYFVLSVSPMAIYVNFLWDYFYDDVTKAFAYDNIAWSTVTYLNMTNYVVNFFLYNLTGQTFREETKKCILGIFKCNRSGNDISNPRFQSRIESNTAPTRINRSTGSDYRF